MHGVHDVFPADNIDDNDPLSLKNLLKLEGEWAVLKEVLGFEFDGVAKTMQLEPKKRDALLDVLSTWLRAAKKRMKPIQFKDFESVVSKIRHAFTAIPAGNGLMTPCNRLLQKRPEWVYLHSNKKLQTALSDMRTLLREASKEPTRCSELVMQNPHYIGVKDASVHGVGGVIFGEGKACKPTVFRVEWPEWIREEVRKTNSGRGGTLTNSDLEMAGLLLLWLIMEDVCDMQSGTHSAVFSDNSPTVTWAQRLKCRGSLVADQLIRAIALRMKQLRVSPLTPLHVPGEENDMTDIPSRSFGSVAKWFCKTDEDLLTLFNSSFPLPDQNTWTVYRPSREIVSRICSVLQMQVLEMDE
jgi:hypothetical protein